MKLYVFHIWRLVCGSWASDCGYKVCLASKSWRTLCMQWIAQLRHFSLHIRFQPNLVLFCLVGEKSKPMGCGLNKKIYCYFMMFMLWYLKSRDIISWRLKCQSWAINYRNKVWQLVDARQGVKKRCQTWHRFIGTRSTRCHVWHRFLTPCLASKTSQTSYT